MLGKHEKYQRLLALCKTLPPIPTAVAVLLATARRANSCKAVS